MKVFKILSIGLVLFSMGFETNAQTEKGNFLLGGESKLNFTFLNSKEKWDDGSDDMGKTTNLQFSPIVGFFIANGIAVGAEVPISYYSYKNDSDDKYSTTSMALAPFIRYYFELSNSNLKPYLHGEIGLGSLKEKYNPSVGSSIDETSGMFLYQIGGGLGIFLNEKVSIDIGLAYSSVSIKSKENNPDNYRDISSGIGLGIGLVIVL